MLRSKAVIATIAVSICAFSCVGYFAWRSSTEAAAAQAKREQDASDRAKWRLESETQANTLKRNLDASLEKHAELSKLAWAVKMEKTATLTQWRAKALSLGFTICKACNAEKMEIALATLEREAAGGPAECTRCSGSGLER